MDDYRHMVNELCDCSEGLTGWECTFVSDMYDWEGEYTEKQAATIEKIWNKVFT